jgi:hypothetical protein
MRQNQGVSIKFAMSPAGHSRPGRAVSKPAHVRNAPVATILSIAAK